MIDWADLDARNAPLNAFVDWEKDASGGDGPLSGLTLGIKSNIAVAGLPWTGGMGVYRERIARHDAEVVAKLRAAGATILGTLNMHEAALGATTDNAFYGRTHNAHRQGYTPGGSSGGSGAAVAAGLCDATLGTDTMGSVRIPAAYNGVYGLKPTHGAISQDGLAMLEPSLDCIGPLARDLDVLERVWEIMSPLPAREGPAVGVAEGEQGAATDARSVRHPPPAPPLQGGEFQLLTLTDLANVAVQPAVYIAYDRALATLDQPIRPITLPDPVTDIRMAGFVASARWLIDELGELRRTKGDLISPELHFMLDYAEKHASRPDVIARTKATLIDALGDDGFLLMPTAPQAAFPHGRPPANQADFTCLASVAGLPALALPAGFDEDRLPVGVQIVGPAGSEARLFALARHLDVKLRGYAPPSQGA